MPITAEDRASIGIGTQLIARHHGETYRAEVIDSHSLRYRLRFRITDAPLRQEFLIGQHRTTLSGLAQLITLGNVNGWRFWSICEADGQPRRNRGLRHPLPSEGRRFGIEIEFCGADDMSQFVLEKLGRHGITAQIQGYAHGQAPRFWKLTRDGSVHPGGYELVSPILQGQDGFDQIRRVCTALQEAGAYVNQTCGMHVHFDMRGMTIEQIRRVVRWYHTNQETMSGFTSPNRHNNGYCRLINTEYLNEIARMTHTNQLGSLPRYHNLNVQCYPRDGSIEFRQHQGTVNATKIMNWINLGLAIIDTAINQDIAVEADSVTDLLDGLTGLAQHVREFFVARAANFAALRAAA